MDMKMYFHTTVGSDHFLFESWKPSTNAGLALACVVSFIGALLYEAIKSTRKVLLTVESIQRRQMGGNGELAIATVPYHRQLFNWWHLLQTLLCAVQTTLAYLLMLIIMTFQLYLLVAIVAGAAVGYWTLIPVQNWFIYTASANHRVQCRTTSFAGDDES